MTTLTSGTTIVWGAAENAASSKQENLPSWNLKDLYQSPEDPAVEKDLKDLEKRAQEFQDQYQGKITTLAADKLLPTIETYEKILQGVGNLAAYAQLSYAADRSDPKIASFYQKMVERTNDITSKMVFFTLELNKRDNVTTESALKKYAPWLRDITLYKPHQLDEQLEKLLHEKAVTGESAWVRLYDETLAHIVFKLGDKDATLSDVLNQLSHADEEKRHQAADSLTAGLKDNIRLLTFITNTLAKNKSIEDKWRKFVNPVASRNLENRIEDNVVEALATAVKEAYPRLTHRYYGLKAKMFGKKQLNYWDRNAPLPKVEERDISWEAAKEKVLTSYRAFSPKMAEIAEQFFTKQWIDAALRKGKDSGAFMHPVTPSKHPYILLNYHGTPRDVMTLAHELGHGIHYVLSAEQGYLMTDTPLTVAETASVFGEMLTFQALLKETTDKKQKRALLASKIEDMLNTVARQIAFFEFEKRVHAERQKGELSTDQISQIWMETQTETLGPAIALGEGYKHYWAYISHFIHAPFYVYAYAFGDCLVNSLYAVYQQNPEGFADKYIELLKAGGTLRYNDLIKPFGLDATDPKFWQKGLTMISQMIDDLEAIDA